MDGEATYRMDEYRKQQHCTARMVGLGYLTMPGLSNELTMLSRQSIPRLPPFPFKPRPLHILINLNTGYTDTAMDEYQVVSMFIYYHYPRPRNGRSDVSICEHFTCELIMLSVASSLYPAVPSPVVCV